MMMCILVKIQGPRVSRLLGMAHRPSVTLPLLNSPASLLTAVPTLPYAPVIPRCLTHPQFTLHGHHSLFGTPLLHPSIWNALLFFLAPWGQTHLLSQLRNHLSAEMRTLSLWGTHCTSYDHLQNQRINLFQCLLSHGRFGARLHFEYSAHNAYC